MSQIAQDPESVRFASKELLAVGDPLGKGAQAVPSVDAGESTQIVTDLLTRIAVWAAKAAECHVTLAGIARSVANDSVSSETELAEQLAKLGDAITVE